MTPRSNESIKEVDSVGGGWEGGGACCQCNQNNWDDCIKTIILSGLTRSCRSLVNVSARIGRV